MKYFLALFLLLAGLGAGCSSGSSNGSSDSSSKPSGIKPDSTLFTGQRPVVTDADDDRAMCQDILKKDGLLVYMPADAAETFGGQWQHQLTNIGTNSCLYYVQKGTFEDAGYRWFAISTIHVYSLQILRAVAEGKIQQTYPVKKIPEITPEAYAVMEQDGSKIRSLYVSKNSQMVNIQCKNCSDEDMLSVGKTIAKNMR
ncbi:MAG: hypothetical protein Q7R83_02415 [bacterium]|nr:hypothetical protein [bacterium]